MLTHLNIQGLAIIDALAIEFSPGFNVITGETGAGKSILIKALGLLLGAKASSETVRRGRDAASVSGLFEAPLGHPAGEILGRYGVPIESEAAGFPILVRRMVNSKGRSFAWINDVPVTVAVLRELADSLIDVFGQHENLRLLDGSQHLAYVDQFLKDKACLTAYLETYAAVQSCLHELAETVEGFRSRRRDADYLGYRCDELRKFAPAKDDYDAVQVLCRRGSQQMTLLAGLEAARTLVDQGAGGEPLGQPLWEAGRALGKLASAQPELTEVAGLATALAAQVDELSYRIGKAISGLEVDETDLEAAQSRLAGYQELFRKLAVHDIDELLATQARLESELGFLQSASAAIASRLKALQELAATLAEAGGRLGKARQKAREAVKVRVESELHELAMPGARLDVELTPVSRLLPALELSAFGREAQALWESVVGVLTGLGEHGAERAQFLLAANPGEAMLPLQKFASGGEISRVTLALKKALAAGADTCILVFDEVDTGISGRVADAVGRKMRELAGGFQVICISHLAQVAAYADTHFLVHKFGKDKRTESTITRLGRRESEAELARLLSGLEVTESSLANAKALINRARGKVAAPSAPGHGKS